MFIKIDVKTHFIDSVTNTQLQDEMEKVSNFA